MGGWGTLNVFVFTAIVRPRFANRFFTRRHKRVENNFIRLYTFFSGHLSNWAEQTFGMKTRVSLFDGDKFTRVETLLGYGKNV